jgi:hypothetical protein
MLNDLDTTGFMIIIYLFIFALGLVGAKFFVKRKNIIGIFFWVSSVLNLFFYLYFMGNYRLYPSYFYPIVNKYRPWINLALFILLIINFIKNKYAKKEINQ